MIETKHEASPRRHFEFIFPISLNALSNGDDTRAEFVLAAVSGSL